MPIAYTACHAEFFNNDQSHRSTWLFQRPEIFHLIDAGLILRRRRALLQKYFPSSFKLISVVLAMAWTLNGAKAFDSRHHSLLIFAPDMLSKNLSKQLAAMAPQQDALEARSITLVYVIGRSVLAQVNSEAISTAVKLRAHYSVGHDEFRAVLANTHGEAVLISDVPISATQLFMTADAVPRRP